MTEQSRSIQRRIAAQKGLPAPDFSEQELREKIADILLELRQYLCNTEFAPEPFTEPVDIEILRVKYPNQILALIDAYYKEKYAGYVKLAEDQTLPQNPFDTTKSGLEKSAYNAFEVAKLRYGNWRKVIIGGR